MSRLEDKIKQLKEKLRETVDTRDQAMAFTLKLQGAIEVLEQELKDTTPEAEAAAE